MMFLDQFFPAAKTRALREEIRGTTQGYDETLNQYWSRYMGLLEACPNHHMLEVEIYSIFYEGMNKESKDLVNSSSGGSFSKLRVSKAKRIMERLLYAKRAYDNPSALLPRRGMANAAAVGYEDQLESRIDKLERALLSAIEKNNPQAPPIKATTVTAQEDHYPNTTGLWISNRSWNLGRQEDAPWREHPNFKWGEGNSNQPDPPQNAYDGSPTEDTQPNWSGRNQHNPHLPNPYQNTTCVPPYQMGYQNYQYHSPQHYQNLPGPDQNQHHYPNQFSQYPSHQNQPNYTYHPHPTTQYNPHHQQNPYHFPYQNNLGKSMEEMMGELLASQQNMMGDLQLNNEVVQGMQNAQKEHKANMDMLNKQLSHLASSMNEISGNTGRLPATVHIPDKANVSKVTLWSGTSYKEPEWKESLVESSKMKDKGGILTKRSGPAETEPVVEPQINEAPNESSKETTKEPEEGVRKVEEDAAKMAEGPDLASEAVGDKSSAESIREPEEEPAKPVEKAESEKVVETEPQVPTAQSVAENSTWTKPKPAKRKLILWDEPKEKQRPTRVSQRCFGRGMAKKTGETTASKAMEISSDKDQEDPTKPGENPDLTTAQKESHLITESESPTATGQEEGTPIKPGENLTEGPKEEVVIEARESQSTAQEETPAPETDVPEKQDKEERYNQERKKKGKGAAKQKKETKNLREVRMAVIIRKLGRLPILIRSKDPSNHHLRPMEKRKVMGTFKNHKKKRVTPLMMYQQKNPLEEGTKEGDDETHNSIRGDSEHSDDVPPAIPSTATTQCSTPRRTLRKQ